MNIKNLIFLYLIASSTLAQGNPIACFDTNAGNFCIELFEKQAPKTVSNFLNYIENEAYTNGIFHRSVTGFILQAGGLKIATNDNGSQIVEVDTLAPVKNEFAISNTRATIAMAKIDGNPDSATSQWFINLGDNSANLDQQNGGFTVFGQVIGDGMQTIDNIANLPTNNFSSLHSSMTTTPTVNFNGEPLLVSNLITANAVKVTENNLATTFNDGALNFPVATGTSEFFEVTLNLIQSEPEIIFSLDFSSIKQLTTAPLNAATFSAQLNNLYIPSVLINNSSIVRNVNMRLNDSTSFQFTLQSIE